MSLDRLLERRRQILSTLDTAARYETVKFLRSYLGRHWAMGQTQVVSADLYKAVRNVTETFLWPLQLGSRPTSSRW